MVSKAGVGLVILVLTEVLSFLNISVDLGTIEAGVNGIFAFAAFILLVWGQLDRKDLKFGLFRK